MNLPPYLFIPQKSIDDPDWEDTIMGGWLTFLNICLILSGILIIWRALYLPSLTFKLIVGTMSTLPLYAAVSLSLRFRDAIFITKSVILFSLITSLLQMAIAILSDYGSHNLTINIISIGAGVAWLVYLTRSNHVKARYPFGDRRIFLIDYIFLVLLTIALVADGIGFSAAAGQLLKEKKEMQAYWTPEKKDSIEKTLDGIHFSMPDYTRLKYRGYEFGEDEVIIDFTIVGEREYDLKSTVEELREFKNVRDDIKHDFITDYPELIKECQKESINLLLRFYIKEPRDGAAIYLPTQELTNIQNEMKKESERLEDLRARVKEYAKRMNGTCPKVYSKGDLTLKSVELYEDQLFFYFQFNESKTNYARAIEEVMEMYPKEGSHTSLFPMEIPYAIRQLGSDIFYELEGSRSGFKKRKDEERVYTEFVSHDPGENSPKRKEREAAVDEPSPVKETCESTKQKFYKTEK